MKVVASFYKLFADWNPERLSCWVNDVQHLPESLAGTEHLSATQPFPLVLEHVGSCPRTDGRHRARIDHSGGTKRDGVEISHRTINPIERIRTVGHDADFRNDAVFAAGYDRNPGGKDFYLRDPGLCRQSEIQKSD